MKKNMLISFSFLPVCLMFLFATPSMAMVLPLPLVQQQQTNWCWAACTQAIESYYSISASQCYMATYFENHYYGEYDNCCQYVTTDCNKGNWLYGTSGSVSEIMNALYSTPNSYYDRYLYQTEVQTEIYAGRPFEMGWAWDAGGGHALVGYGITGNQMTYMDPWPANNTYNVASYLWVVNSHNDQSYTGPQHSWIQTITPQVTPNPPIPTVLANGAVGSIWVSQYTTVNVTIDLNPGGFTNTQADWWVFAYLNGYIYYYHYDSSSGTWQWTTQGSPTFQGGLSGLSPFSVFNGTVPAGTSITFYFAVDLTMDGAFDSPYYYNYVTVTGY